jgi:hypothetical protein
LGGSPSSAYGSGRRTKPPCAASNDGELAACGTGSASMAVCAAGIGALAAGDTGSASMAVALAVCGAGIGALAAGDTGSASMAVCDTEIGALAVCGAGRATREGRVGVGQWEGAGDTTPVGGGAGKGLGRVKTQMDIITTSVSSGLRHSA